MVAGALLPNKNNEWYTPEVYIAAARQVMGGKTIDLDPASCAYANAYSVHATRFFTKEENGLLYPWGSRESPYRLWINPPYGRLQPEKTGSTRSYQQLFIRKLLEEVAYGHVYEAVALLLGNACFMRWFQPLWHYPLCFHNGHIVFERADGTTASFGFGTIFVYIGPHEEQFDAIFSQFGPVVTKRTRSIPSLPLALPLPFA